MPVIKTTSYSSASIIGKTKVEIHTLANKEEKHNIRNCKLTTKSFPATRIT